MKQSIKQTTKILNLVGILSILVACGGPSNSGSDSNYSFSQWNSAGVLTSPKDPHADKLTSMTSTGEIIDEGIENIDPTEGCVIEADNRECFVSKSRRLVFSFDSYLIRHVKWKPGLEYLMPDVMRFSINTESCARTENETKRLLKSLKVCPQSPLLWTNKPNWLYYNSEAGCPECELSDFYAWREPGGELSDCKTPQEVHSGINESGDCVNGDRLVFDISTFYIRILNTLTFTLINEGEVPVFVRPSSLERNHGELEMLLANLPFCHRGLCK